MKHLFFTLTLLALTATATIAQSEAEIILLTFDLWPDYDRPQLLVLITGGLAPDAPLPATISLPLPDGAVVNAVARINSAGDLIGDVTFKEENGFLTLITPDPGFRVEYYQPYLSNGDAHTVAFRWVAPTAVRQAAVTVQQPRFASDFTLTPEASEIRVLQDGLRYHVLSPRPLASGEALALDIAYTLPSGQLSTANATTPTAAPQFDTPTWILISLGSLLLLVAAVFLVQGLRERQQAPRKPKRAKVNYCPNCGTAVKGHDQFCRNCGERL